MSTDSTNFSIRRFILPEQSVSLKMIFDNAKNYVVCGVLLLFAIWIRKSDMRGFGHLLFLNGNDFRLLAEATVLLLGIALGLLNFAQTYLMFE